MAYSDPPYRRPPGADYHYCQPVADYLDAANLVMIYLLGVVVIAPSSDAGFGTGDGYQRHQLLDLFFIAPRGTLAVSDVQYILTFGVMLTVGLVIGNLTACCSLPGTYCPLS